MRVFVTSHGRHFHRHGRHWFTGSGKATVTVGSALKAGYKPCSRCFPPPPPVGRDPSDTYLDLVRRSRSGG